MSAQQQPNASTSPQSLIQRIQAGDRQAETDLVHTYWRSLFYIINKRAQDPHLAADITQEALIIAIEKGRRGLFKNGHGLTAFIRQTGINLLLSHYRKEKRRGTDTSDDIDVQFPHQQAELAAQLSQQQLAAITQQVLAELSTARDKDLLLRYCVYDQSKQQICDELGLSPDHFDRVLYRARQRLKQLLQVKFNADKFTIGQLLVLVLLAQGASDHTFGNNTPAQMGELRSPRHLIYSK